MLGPFLYKNTWIKFIVNEGKIEVYQFQTGEEKPFVWKKVTSNTDTIWPIIKVQNDSFYRYWYYIGADNQLYGCGPYLPCAGVRRYYKYTDNPSPNISIRNIDEIIPAKFINSEKEDAGDIPDPIPPIPETQEEMKCPKKQLISPSTKSSAPVRKDRPPASPTNPNNTDFMIQSIKSAIDTAQDIYSQWFNDKNGNFKRGSLGFFTRLRHGQRGQQRALNFVNEINGLTDYGQIITKIQLLLSDPKTRYHRHSFASFLMDYLLLVPKNEWDSIDELKKKQEDKYDQSTVIQTLGFMP